MITFDNFRFNNHKLTMDLLEGLRFIAATAMIDNVNGEQRQLVCATVDGSWASQPGENGYTTYSGYGHVKVANIDGGCVAHMYLVDSASVWFGGYNMIGFTVDAESISFSDHTGVTKLVRECAPNFDVPFRVAYQLEFDADMLLVFQSLLVYNGDQLIGACTWNLSSVASYISIDVNDSEPPGSGDIEIGFKMNDLCRPVTYLTVDVSEAPQESAARLMSNLPVTYFARYDGSVLALRTNLTRDTVFDISEYDNLAEVVTIQVNDAEIVTRARVSGALPQGEALNLAAASKYLLRFRVYQNPEIMSENDAVEEAERLIVANFQETHTRTLTWNTMPFLERLDVVEIDGVRYIYKGGVYSIGNGMYGSVSLALESDQ